APAAGRRRLDEINQPDIPRLNPPCNQGARVGRPLEPRIVIALRAVRAQLRFVAAWLRSHEHIMIADKCGPFPIRRTHISLAATALSTRTAGFIGLFLRRRWPVVSELWAIG